MATFDVTVGGVNYEVDAPDERTAWKWANVIHSQGAQARVEALPPERRDIRGKLVTEDGGIPKPLLELATGGTGITRGALNLISKGTGTKLLPPAGDPESGWG